MSQNFSTLHFFFYWDFNYKSASVFSWYKVSSKCHIDLITNARELTGLKIRWRLFHLKNYRGTEEYFTNVNMTFNAYIQINFEYWNVVGNVLSSGGVKEDQISFS